MENENSKQIGVLATSDAIEVLLRTTLELKRQVVELTAIVKTLDESDQTLHAIVRKQGEQIALLAGAPPPPSSTPPAAPVVH
jgi:hypothetical protein